MVVLSWKFKIIMQLSALVSAVVALAAMTGVQGAMKPTKFAKEVVCEGCHAVISEANKILGKGKRTDKTVQNALRGVCNVQRLNQYEFSPPTMNKVCDYWTTNYMAEAKAALTNGLPEEEQEIELCFVTTDICQGVDRSNFRINKYEGPSKRKIRAAIKAAKGETTEEEGEEEEKAAKEDEGEKKPETKEEKKKKKKSKKDKKDKKPKTDSESSATSDKKDEL